MKNPPTADCCVRPPTMIHIDKNGDVIGSFTPVGFGVEGHGMAVDREGFVYIGQFTVRKYDPKTGKALLETPRAADLQPGGAGAEAGAVAPADPSRGGPGPGGTFPQTNPPRPPDRAAIAAFRAKYPPSSPMIVANIEEIRIDEAAHELYATDSYLGGRVMVFDLATLKFKRGWGAYGHAISEISTSDEDRAYTPGGPLPKEFKGHVTLNISNDGLVYAADRNANRIQVTTKEGKFLKEFALAPTTGEGGSTGGVAFSPDKAQRLKIKELAPRWVALGGGGYNISNVARAWTLAWAVMNGVELREDLPESFSKEAERTGVKEKELRGSPENSPPSLDEENRREMERVVRYIKEKIFPKVRH